MPGPDDAPAVQIDKKLQVNLDSLKALLGDGNDLRVHPLRFGPNGELSGALVFIDGLVDNLTLSDAILRPLQNWRVEDDRLPPNADLLDALGQQVLCAACIKSAQSLSALAAGCLSGDTVLLVDGCEAGLVISTKGWEKRSVAEPQTETVVRGPARGVHGRPRTNTSLIRRKIRNGRLHMEQMTIGARPKPACA